MDEDIVEKLKALYLEKEKLDKEISDLERVEYMEKYHDKIKIEVYDDFVNRMNYDR